MKTAKRIFVLLILIPISVVHGESDGKPAKKLSDTLSANCLLKISADPAILPLDITLLDALLHSTGVGGNAAREVLGISTDEIQDFDLIRLEEIPSTAIISPVTTTVRRPGESTAQYEARRRAEAAARARTLAKSRKEATIWSESSNLVNEESILIRLQVNLDKQMKPAAEEFLSALVDNLKLSLCHTFDDYRQRLEDYNETAEIEATRTEQDLRDKQNDLRNISGSGILDSDKVLLSIDKLRNDIQEIKMEQALNQISIDATTKQIADIQDKMNKEINKDGISKDLFDLMVLQEKNLKNIEMLFKSGSASDADLASAREKITRARIEWAKRKEQMGKSAGGDLIESLTSQLADYSIKETQNKEKLKSLEQQLAETNDLLLKADDYELLSLKVDIAKENLREVLVWRDKISRQVRMLQLPAVSVLGGK